MNIVTCAIPCDSTGLVEHILSYLCRLNADSLSFTDHQKADVCMGVVRRLLGLSGYVMGASDTIGAIIPPVHGCIVDVSVFQLHPREGFCTTQRTLKWTIPTLKSK